MINKIFKFVLNLILTIIVIMMIFLVYNFTQTKILKKDYCNVFGFTAFKVATGSMSGTIEVGDIIIVEIKKDNTKYKVDDIIAFKQNGYRITHRIIDIDGDKITTKGDANNAEDEPISKTEVLGKVIKIFPNISIWEKVFLTPKVYISVIITVVLFVLTFSIKDDEKEKKQINTKNSEEKKDV